MATFLILYHTTDGHTQKICLRMQHILQDLEHDVTVSEIGVAARMDLQGFDTIIIGASVRHGRHNPLVAEFINRNEALLTKKHCGFFSVSLVARKPGKNRPDTNPYVRKLLKRLSFWPTEMAVFAGRLEYQRYSVLDRWIIRLIMLITGGPTDPKTDVEFTDWQAVEAFARHMSALTTDAPAALEE